MSHVSGDGAARTSGAPVWAEFARYVAVSGGAFIVDFSALAIGVEVFGLPLLTANAISFTLGLITVYVGSILWVFERRTLANKRVEFAVFCLIGLIGLGVNQLALWGATSLIALPYMIGKVGAAAASFAANFALRKTALFR